MTTQTNASLLADPCELAPQYIRAIAPYQPGKPIAPGYVFRRSFHA